MFCLLLLLEEKNLKEVFGRKYLTYWETGKKWDFFVQAGEKLFVSRMNEEFLEEMKGIAAGARRVRLTQLMEQHYGEIDLETARQVFSDHYDVYLQKEDNPCSRTVEGHCELDPFQYWAARLSYQPAGAVDGKV